AKFVFIRQTKFVTVADEIFSSSFPHPISGQIGRQCQPKTSRSSSSRLPSPWPAPSAAALWPAVDKQPACLSCFDSRLANTCAACGAKIGCDSKDVSYGQRHWHEACFRCAGCSAQMAGSSFSVKSDAIYCLMCYETRFAERCSRCREAFKAGQRKFEFRSRQYHDSCFLCCECGAQIGGASFIPRGGSGANDESADYKGRPYHSDCLVCGHCAKPLCGLKFTSHEDRPFCGDCYGELFARRCSACLKPITGFAGSKFISFEQRDWHSQCFNCARCGASLVGKGFLADGEKVVCTECGGVGGGGGASGSGSSQAADK
uniref:Four and a half LIM domains protein 2 n=1 Tax=Macrostomum lignano TaxID=282301 RepID=A0A1I8FZW2_9PLAT